MFIFMLCRLGGVVGTFIGHEFEEAVDFFAEVDVVLLV